ncbi:hypothetical protein GF386_03995 [Candidatus Pacearchaeota archaeon]|nr:hypothetical protein [Candidatus Pacearchaeota archaeon]MBD3283311.1 hypothetical protein [Candidatus Pacearchaeota archaeon]
MGDNLFGRIEGTYHCINNGVLSIDRQFREPSLELFRQYLQHLREHEHFSEIPASEHAEYTVFWGHKEMNPDEMIRHEKGSSLFRRTKEGAVILRGIRIYKSEGYDSDPANYPPGNSTEAYLLEDGTILECQVDNQTKGTPLDPQTQTTRRIHDLTRTETERGYVSAHSFIGSLSILELRELLQNMGCYMDKGNEKEPRNNPEDYRQKPSHFRSEIERPEGDGPYERPDGH